MFKEIPSTNIQAPEKLQIPSLKKASDRRRPSVGGSEMNEEVPSTNIQGPEKLQASNPKHQGTFKFQTSREPGRMVNVAEAGLSRSFHFHAAPDGEF